MCLNRGQATCCNIELWIRWGRASGLISSLSDRETTGVHCNLTYPCGPSHRQSHHSQHCSYSTMVHSTRISISDSISLSGPCRWKMATRLCLAEAILASARSIASRIIREPGSYYVIRSTNGIKDERHTSMLAHA